MRFPALKEIVEVDGEVMDNVEDLLDYAIKHGTWSVDFSTGHWDDAVEDALTSAGNASAETLKNLALEHIRRSMGNTRRNPYPAEVIQALAGAAMELTREWFQSEEAPDVLEKSLESATLTIRVPVELIGAR